VRHGTEWLGKPGDRDRGVNGHIPLYMGADP
jgi:hypothetical protein